jgi:chromosomal replication initiation ATPase DnaA
LVKKPSLSKVAEELAKRLKVSHEDLRKPDRSWNQSRARTLIAHVLVKYGGFKVGEVAAYFGRDQTTISSLLSRFSHRAQEDLAVQSTVERLAQIV